MREHRISNNTYEIAATTLLKKAGFDIESLRSCKILAKKNDRLLYIDIAGKQLPYLSRSGEGKFPWETHLKPDRLDRIKDRAKRLKAEPWLCFCYYLRNPEYKQYFNSLTGIGVNIFGIRMIDLDAYLLKMKPRSRNSWGAVELPRKEVLKLTLEANDI